MPTDQTARTALALGMERPPFGQFARQVGIVSPSDLADCLHEQRTKGGRIGELLHRRGLLTRDQIAEVLGLQAAWMADVFRNDVPGGLASPVMLSVVIPTHNHAAQLPDALDAALSALPAFVQQFEILVVDDASDDGTAAVAQQYTACSGNVRLLSHLYPRGYGAALESGLKEAHGDLVLLADAEGRYNLLDLPHMMSHMAAADVVAGYRCNPTDGWARRLGDGWRSWWTSKALGVPAKDAASPLRLFRRELADRLHLTATGPTVLAEMSLQVKRAGLRVVEVPVGYTRSIGGTVPSVGNALSLWKCRRNAYPLRPVGNGEETSASVPSDTMTPVPVGHGQVSHHSEKVRNR